MLQDLLARQVPREQPEQPVLQELLVLQDQRGQPDLLEPRVLQEMRERLGLQVRLVLQVRPGPPEM